jgi:hemerythrin-like domain-containing protein
VYDRNDRFDPFAQLERSHRRLEEACEALTTAARDRDIETIADVCAFLARQVRRHEEDEDSSLFPRLEGKKAELDEVIALLAREHREHAALHERLERALSGRSDDGDLWADVAAIAGALTQAYRAHIEREERVLFPAAQELLSEDARRAVMSEMDARRGRG